MLAISIIVAVLTAACRYKSLKNQRIKRHESFMKRQRIVASGHVPAEQNGKTLDLVEEKMKQLRYHVRREDRTTSRKVVLIWSIY